MSRTDHADGEQPDDTGVSGVSGVPGGSALAVAPGRRTGDWVRLGLRGLGQTLITAGVVILLFVVYEVWVTNIFSAQKQTTVRHQLEQAWADGKDPIGTRLALPGSTQNTIPVGTGIANIYIPRFGRDYAFTVVEGTSDASLAKGPGHYVGTALPGGLGNFSVAGHRVGKGEPFLNLDQLLPGDPVVVETEKNWFIYRVLGTGSDLGATGADGVPGREIVYPSDTAVILPVPDHPGLAPTEDLLTLTTCHPKYTANQRMIIHGVLSSTIVRAGDSLPTELGGTLS